MSSFDPGSRGLKPYAMVGPEGWHYIGLHENEEDVWRVVLGWPTVGEVKERKANGVFVTEITCSYESKGK